ncbi:hypothetical protein [Natronosalvus rutilus]|nr:hypothetical protein [Natronosalvus rutilus]
MERELALVVAFLLASIFAIFVWEFVVVGAICDFNGNAIVCN